MVIPARDPKPTVDRIEELAQRIIMGDIRLPKFQRNFVWQRDQVLELLDSIAQNYPIGSVLVWLSRQKLASERSIADLPIREREEEYPVNYLLDGQQRLSTICGALYWSGNDPNSVWNIAFDLRKSEFIHLDSVQDPPLHLLRTNKLGDATKLYRHISALDTLDAPDKEQLKSNAEALFKRFVDYRIAVVTLADMPLDSVAPIFERINSTGTRLTIVDLMRAATWSPAFDLIDTIDDMILEEVKPKGFGGIERKAVLRNLSAAAGEGFSSDKIDNLRDRKPEELKAAAANTVEAYKRAVDFLSTQIKLPSDASVPYSNQVVVLAELYRQIPNPTPAQQQAIMRWFWRTSYGAYFSGWNTGQMASDLQAIREFASGRTEGLIVNTIKPSEEVWKARSFRANSALSKVLAMLLAFRRPLDLRLGTEIDTGRSLSWSNAKEFHHIFPQAYLKDLGYDAGKINSLANIALLTSGTNKYISDKKPSAYIGEFEREHESRFSHILNSNYISDEALDALKRDHFEDFLRARAKTLHSEAVSYAAWNDETK